MNTLTNFSQTLGAQHRVFWFIPATLRAMAIELVVVLVVLIAAATVPMFMGNRTVVVMSGSMEPAIWTGSAVVSSPVPSGELQVGDVVVFAAKGAALPMVHRILTIQEREGTRYYTTQGDANPTKDAAEVTVADTAWRVSYSVPFAGYLIYGITKPLGTVMTLVIPVAGLALLAGWDQLKKHKQQTTMLRA